MSVVKEPGYFAPDVPGTRRRGHPFAYPTDEERYLALFADARDEKRLGEASTSYLMSEGAPARIRAFQPDARIIASKTRPTACSALSSAVVKLPLDPASADEEALEWLKAAGWPGEQA
mgnify:CR=1 FL=1